MAIDVTVRGWSFPRGDHCWAEEIPVHFYRDHPLCSSCSSGMKMIASVHGSSGALSLALGECPDCGHVQKVRRIDWSAAGDHFADRWLSRRVDRSFAPRTVVYDRLRSILAPHSRVLEVGCGSGYNFPAFIEAGHAMYGFDPSKTEIEIGRAAGLKNIEVASAEEYLDGTKDTFDVIFLFNVLPFLSDPFSILKRFAKRLNDDGILYVSSGSVWHTNIALLAHWSIIPDHATVRSLRHFADRAGLTVIEIEEGKDVSIIARNRTADSVEPATSDATGHWNEKINRDLRRRKLWQKSIPVGVRGCSILLDRPKQSSGDCLVRFIHTTESPLVLMK